MGEERLVRPVVALVAVAVLVAGCEDDLSAGFAGGPGGVAGGITGPGAGLTLGAEDELEVDFEGSGSDLGVADTVARGDHVHDAVYVLKAGDTMTGDLDMNGTQTVTNLAAPAGDSDAATKLYVDNQDALKSDVGHNHDADYVDEGQAGSITTGMIANGAVTTAKLAAKPVAAGAGGNQRVTLSTTAQVVRSVTINCPSAGTVIVNASGYITFTSTGDDIARWSITTGTSIDFSYLGLDGDQGCTDALDQFRSFASVRTFSVGAGNRTFRLVADVPIGTVDMSDTNISALFIPN